MGRYSLIVPVLLLSPSTRRAWIEILYPSMMHSDSGVALHPEGVDRNHFRGSCFGGCKLSPSTRRAWIEIEAQDNAIMIYKASPSTRRAWIEITPRACTAGTPTVALHPEGVDRNE